MPRSCISKNLFFSEFLSAIFRTNKLNQKFVLILCFLVDTSIGYKFHSHTYCGSHNLKAIGGSGSKHHFEVIWKISLKGNSCSLQKLQNSAAFKNYCILKLVILVRFFIKRTENTNFGLFYEKCIIIAVLVRLSWKLHQVITIL